ncbi:hypothetical protein [Sulfolobus acidocaldarius]|uniref:Uncharacterized protein n=4 Tax=Sulfolobus acidocaldarius TaxID=2285 RepID=Q4JB05_SULAC|nr:hypothetical protein [Sulfolobus acidocaldarius]AAY80024.1 hypothetical protein Saci_0635 [Sulfolobus acidocaldarius DSM 639]AGE70595.1 hypothetical protein SacN8_03085 [Sulfolobus acidocaldarius N8]AGE72868.1 hypothetical protein SacRon12I_03075 [Sulfolobus acidocaldarius Ron12/I]ALU29052.1 hypothetical protein ATY89_03225 [Sulfolobus acidocaldarius]ALU31777.1 hypothetical protein ATZ20_06250 [Sulfolobus acidocaldarius]
MEWVKHLSPDEREFVVNFVLQRSKLPVTEIAESLGISRISLYKMSKGEIHASDDTIIGLFSLLSDKDKLELLLKLRGVFERVLREIDEEIARVNLKVNTQKRE